MTNECESYRDMQRYGNQSRTWGNVFARPKSTNQEKWHTMEYDSS